MNETVSGLSMVFMAISCLIGFALPVAMLLWIRFKKKADIVPFFIGCAVMVLFALVVEAAIHRVVLGSAIGARIQNSLWLYALYGGLMAGLFEETGRFLAFKTVLKKYRRKDVNALMYGAGHGGIEAAVLLGITMVNNLIYSVMINTGAISAVIDPLPEDLKQQMQSAVRALITTPAHQFLLGGVERLFAVALQISLSVLVWFAAKKAGKWYLYPLAIALHCVVDGAAAALSGLGVNVFLIEAAVLVMSIAAAVIARQVWKANAEGETEHAD